MPELLTKHPDLALQILKDAKIKCDTNAKPQILVTCPKHNFCTLPTGELCIYGTKDFSQMTQIQAYHVLFTPTAIIPIVLILLIGIFIGTKLK